MLKLVIKPKEFYDDKTNQFYYFPEKETEIQLEHSLISVSKWEAKWHKPFLSKDKKTNEELLDYIQCMCLTTNVNMQVINCIDQSQSEQINDYISDSMTATTFGDKNDKGGVPKIVTSEVIYYMMIAFGIPFECQKWHLNRLLTLIRVCSEKSQPAKKMSQKEIMNRNRALNKARRAQLGSRG